MAGTSEERLSFTVRPIELRSHQSTLREETMTALELIHLEMKRLRKSLDGALDGLTAEQLHAVPANHPKANTIAWGVWHVVRTEDNVVRFVLQNRRAPVWTEAGYAEKLGLPPVAQGTGMSSEEAHALRIEDVDLFQEYMRAVWTSTDDFVGKTDANALDAMITVKPLGEMPGIRALAQVCASHGMLHFGEIELARTLDLAEVQHPMRGAHLCERADTRHLAEWLDRDHRVEGVGVSLADEVVGARPHRSHVLLKEVDVLDPERVRLLRRHTGALCHRRQAELLGVASLGPHGRATVLQDEAHHV